MPRVSRWRGRRSVRCPPALVEQATAREVPLVELVEVVRFVEVTRAINSRLIAESVRELQFNDKVTHTLAAVLAAQGDIQALTSALRDITRCSITVRSVAGAEIASAKVEGARPRRYARITPIDSGGITIATLEILPRPGVDLQMVEAACRHAPEPLALALLRGQPLSRSDQHVREIFRLLSMAEHDRTGRLSPADARAMQIAGRDIGFDGPGVYVGVVTVAPHGPLQTIELSEVLRGNGAAVLSEIRDGRHQSIVRMSSRGDRRGSATDLIRRLRSTALPAGLRTGVTDPADDILGLARSMGVAHNAAGSATAQDCIASARDFTLDHFVGQLDSAVVDQFLDATLRPLLTSDRGVELVATLAAVYRNGSRVAAAKSLNIHRQTMYQRLEHISTILGKLPDDNSDARGALMVAVEIAERLGRIDEHRGG